MKSLIIAIFGLIASLSAQASPIQAQCWGLIENLETREVVGGAGASTPVILNLDRHLRYEERENVIVSNDKFKVTVSQGVNYNDELVLEFFKSGKLARSAFAGSRDTIVSGTDLDGFRLYANCKVISK